MNNKRILMLLGGLLLLCILCVCAAGIAYIILLRSTEPLQTGMETAATAAEAYVQDLASTPAPTREPAVDPSQQRWLVMLYQNGDDEILEQDIFFDANEAEYTGSSERVTIVSQLDRYYGAFDGDGDWSSARRFYLSPDPDLNLIRSQMLMDLGEVNMGDPAALVDFASWAIMNYPADRYVLILSDHGAGWHGGWSDSDNGEQQGLLMRDIDQALRETIERTGIGKFDVVVFDACLMAQIESLTMIQPHARYAVASEETIPSIGLAYNGFISGLVQDPAMSAENLARLMVSTYIDQDMRIVDDDARAVFLGDSFTNPENITPEELAEVMSLDTTLTAVDLEALPYLNAALNSLVYEMTFIDQNIVARARTFAQSYYNLYGADTPPSFIDLGNFAELLSAEADNTQISTAANRLYKAMDDAIITERHGPERPGSTGISFYFPNSALYQSEFAGYAAYNHSVDRFVEQSQWDDFLAFHYTGKAFEPDTTGPVIPAQGADILAPGLGDIQISPLAASAEVIQQGDSVLIETQVTGKNMGNIYFFAGKYFPESSSYLAIDADFVVSDTTREVNGVYYPDWGGGPVDIAIEWTPRTYFISDGNQTQFAVLYPLYYGAERGQNVYAVDGIYTFGGSGEQTYAVMNFGADGWMIEVTSFQPQGGGGPREIVPQQGDSYTLLLKSIALTDDPDAEPEFVEFEGGTLTFGSSSFYWDYTDAEPGEYVAGVGVLDLDGNYNLDFVPVRIE